jgi:isocitrate dehydrogenase (NAD+)
LSREVTVIPGDTTGPEIYERLKPLMAAAGVDIAWDEPSDDATLDSMLASARRTGVVLMAWQQGRRHQGEMPPVVQLRRKLQAFANVRPLRSFPGIEARCNDVDIIVVRETTEGIYAHLEHETLPGVFESLKITTRPACERIARYAFDLARSQNRKRVTVAHKSNILKKSDGLFLKIAMEVAADYPDIQADECIVDALCMKVVINPNQYDVLLAGNLFGDMIADVVTGLIGGPSNAPSINVGMDGTRLFTAGHGDPPEMVGTGRGDPMTLLLPMLHLLVHIDERAASDRLYRAIVSTLQAGTRPVALGGEATINGFIDSVQAAL